MRSQPCSPAAAATSPTARTRPAGGVANIPIELTIARDGSATLVSEFDGALERFELSPDELAELREQLDAADLDAVELPPDPPTCADCFLYEVTYDGVTASYDDAGDPPDSVAEAVAHLERLAAAHTPPPA